MIDPTTSTGMITKMNEELSNAYKEEEEFWKKRSRQLWLTLGDRNTGYFHAITKSRKAINKFSVIENEEGQSFFEEDKILEVIIDYYQQLFTMQENQEELSWSIVQEALVPCISEETNEKLIAIPSAEEIKVACFSIHPDKAPGPDGFSASFYQTNWETVKNQVILEIQSFFSSGLLPCNINNTHVRLIPKIKSPKKMTDYRPIALCSVYYKIIAKLLTKRLQPFLAAIISENQSAFVPQRAIADNVLITHEVLHYLHTSGAKKQCYMAVKTDMSKAYDRIEWSFVRMVLERLGFHCIWITWIMQCITSVSYSYMLNGAVQGLVNPQRGLRQGDPLSPYVFILCSEVLSGLCIKTQRENRLTGIKVGKKSPRLNHLLFADDTMFFCKSEAKECDTLLEILQKYETASGQKINPQKSAFTFSTKTLRAEKDRVKTQLGIASEGGSGKYLGLPELFGRKKKDLFNMIVDRIRQSACSWSSKFLSTAGKIIMLKSVLATMPAYSMSCFKLPGSLYKRIQSALTRFWWDTSMEKKKMCWVSWKALTKAKRDGGLGFRDLQSFNDALLAKLSWRILSKPNCLLAKILLGKYCHTSKFLDSQVPTSSSHGWRGICIGRDLLKTQLGRVLGDGKSTSLWYDPWLSLTAPSKPMGPPAEQSQKLMVSHLISLDTLDWDREKIKQTLPDLEKDILEIKLSSRGATDSYAWLPSKNGIYNTKYGYFESLDKEDDRENHDSTGLIHSEIQGFEWTKEIWNVKTSPKTKFFLWKVMRGALPLGVNLKARNINATAMCPFCGQEESALHLFFRCTFVKKIWDLAPFKTPIAGVSIPSLRAGLEVSKLLIGLPPSGLNEGPLLPWILWAIWLARNQKIFSNKSASPMDIVTHATSMAREWNLAQASGEISIKKKSNPVQQTRVDGCSLCFTDAAWAEKSRAAGYGWIIKHRPYSLRREGSAAEFHIRSPLMAEAIAIKHALHQALTLGITDLFLASDSKQVIEAINSEQPSPELHGILHDILHLSLNFRKISFNFIPRAENQEADAIAKLALRNFVIDP